MKRWIGVLVFLSGIGWASAAEPVKLDIGDVAYRWVQHISVRADEVNVCFDGTETGLDKSLREISWILAFEVGSYFEDARVAEREWRQGRRYLQDLLRDYNWSVGARMAMAWAVKAVGCEPGDGLLEPQKPFMPMATCETGLCDCTICPPGNTCDCKTAKYGPDGVLMSCEPPRSQCNSYKAPAPKPINVIPNTLEKL